MFNHISNKNLCKYVLPDSLISHSWWKSVSFKIGRMTGNMSSLNTLANTSNAAAEHWEVRKKKTWVLQYLIYFTKPGTVVPYKNCNFNHLNKKKLSPASASPQLKWPTNVKVVLINTMMQQFNLDYKNHQHGNLTSLVGGKQGRLRSNIFKGQYCSAFSMALSKPTFPTQSFKHGMRMFFLWDG